MRTLFFSVIFIGAMYHLIGDVLQIIGIDIFLVNIGNWRYGWCGRYCNSMWLLVDFFLVASSAIVIRRRSIGILGLFATAVVSVGLLMWLRGTGIIP